MLRLNVCFVLSGVCSPQYQTGYESIHVAPDAVSSKLFLQIYYTRRKATLSCSAIPPGLTQHSAATQCSNMFNMAVLYLYMKASTLRWRLNARSLVGVIHASRQKQISLNGNVLLFAVEFIRMPREALRLISTEDRGHVLPIVSTHVQSAFKVNNLLSKDWEVAKRRVLRL